jgi:hypothetical protein
MVLCVGENELGGDPFGKRPLTRRLNHRFRDVDASACATFPAQSCRGKGHRSGAATNIEQCLWPHCSDRLGQGLFERLEHMDRFCYQDEVVALAQELPVAMCNRPGSTWPNGSIPVGPNRDQPSHSE